MTISNIKENLHKRIDQINDGTLLLAINELIDQTYKDTSILSPYQKKRLTESEEQIKEGDYFTEEQADYLIDKWLKE